MSGGHFEYREADESLEWYKECGLTDRQVQALRLFAEEDIGSDPTVP